MSDLEARADQNQSSVTAGLNRWREIIASSPGVPLSELGLVGYRLFSTDGGSPSDGRVVPAVDRSDADPIQLRLLNRIIARAVGAEGAGTYQDRSELLHDVTRLLAQTAIPPSRHAAYNTLESVVRGARGGRGGCAALLGDSGIGKTYLCRSLEERERKPEDLWVYEKSPQAGGQPYAVCSSVLVQLIEACATSEAMSPSAVLAEVLRRPGAHEGARGLLPGMLPDDWSVAVGDASGRGATNQLVDYAPALAALIRELAVPAGSAVIVIDDLQWSDLQSVEVVRELATSPGPIALVLLGRPEAAERLPSSVVSCTTLGGLTDDESRDLLKALLIGQRAADETRLLPWIAARAGGNPLAIVETVRDARQIDLLTTGFSSGSILLRSLDRSLDALSSEGRLLVEHVSLLLPPVPAEVVREIPGLTPQQIDAAVEEAVSAGLLVRDAAAGRVRFRHDSIESAARRRARIVPERVTNTARLLQRRAGSGDRRAAYALALMLTDDDGLSVRAGSGHPPRPGVLSSDQVVSILLDAAHRALSLAVPEDALMFAEFGLPTAHARGDASAELELHEIAHEAAFLLDDGRTMSRHFQYIHARAGDLEVNRARTLWISRSYVKLWIRGAARVGWKALHELGAVASESLGDEQAREREIRSAVSFLRRCRPRTLYRRMLGRGPAADERSPLVVTTASTLFISMLTIDPDRLAVLAWIILREALDHGYGPHTSSGLLLWAVWAAGQPGGVRTSYLLGELAVEFMNDVPAKTATPAARQTISTSAAIFARHWMTDHRRLAEELERLHEAGLRIANHEWAFHAAHVHSQSLLLIGVPLRTLFDLMTFYRERAARVGVARIVAALGKWQQAVECLMGDTPDPLALNGSVLREDEALAALFDSEDTLGRAGFFLIKAMLGVYGGDCETAVRACERFQETLESAQSVYAVTVYWFMYGMAAWSTGRGEAGQEALRRVRSFGTHASGRHRITALRAERARHHGSLRRASRLYRRAVREALGDGLRPEAALISERRAEVERRLGNEAGTLQALHAARSLYLAWGAVPAANRVGDALRSAPGEPSPPRVPGARLGGAADEHEGATGDAVAGPGENAQLLFTAVVDGLLLTSALGVVLYYSPGAAKYLTVNANETADLASDLSPNVLPLIQRAIEDDRPRDAEVGWRNLTLQVTASPAPSSREPGVVALVIRDVSRLRERERALIVADRMSSLGMLAATVAHEVGNPNHVIQLNARTLEMILARLREGGGATNHASANTSAPPAPGWDQAERAVESIEEGTGRIEQVIRQITEYAREGREEQREWINPDDICRRVLRFTRLLVAEYTSEVLYEPGERLPPVYVVRGRLEQALINLIKNACEAIESREARIKLTVDHDDDGYVCFSVRDQGPGILASGIVNADGSVVAFRSTRAGQGGTGLGLSIVTSIVEQHG
ncbi:MAG: AAA family ATPase, partial [Spirochaetota bacterium]